jgi:DNA adenine methylase
MLTEEKIVNLAYKFNVHPIHIRLFLSNKKVKSKQGVEFDYKKYLEKIPRPFVKWVGGKRQLLQQFKNMDLYPPHGFNPKTGTYFEPFVGGGAMFFDLLPKRAVLSDTNLELVTTYNVIKNNVQDLITKLKEHQRKNSKEYFLKIRSQDIEKLSDLDIAARFIYLNRTCFNGLFRVNNKGKFNVPYGDNHNPIICNGENLIKVSEFLSGIKIKHKDYKEVLVEAKRGDFIYFDPPYYPKSKTSNFTKYTSGDFLENEQKELRDVYIKLHRRGCFVMLSNSDTPFINKLYSGLGKEIKINKVFASRSINSIGSKRGLIREVVVINY